MLRRNQIAATIIYCNVLLLQLELQYFNSLQQGTPPCGNTAATLSLWPNMTTFYPDPEDAVKPWNCQVKLPGFRKLEIGNKTCDPTGPTKPVDSMAQNYHQNPRSRKRNLQQMRAQVIFCLVWDFRSRPFSLFLGSFLGAFSKSGNALPCWQSPLKAMSNTAEGTYTVPIIFSSLSLCVKLSCEYWW